MGRKARHRAKKVTRQQSFVLKGWPVRWLYFSFADLAEYVCSIYSDGDCLKYLNFLDGFSASILAERQRHYECLPLSCPSCGAEMRLIAVVTDAASVKPILVLGLPAEPPRVAPARDPPLDDLDQTPAFDPADPVPEPEYEFDQSVSW